MIARDSVSYPTLAVIQHHGVTDDAQKRAVWRLSEALSAGHRAWRRGLDLHLDEPVANAMNRRVSEACRAFWDDGCWYGEADLQHNVFAHLNDNIQRMAASLIPGEVEIRLSVS